MIKRYYSSYTGKQIDEAVKTIVENQIGLEDLSPELVAEIKSWVATGEGGEGIRELEFDSRSKFPELGNPLALYIATDEDRIYYWSNKGEYRALTSPTPDAIINQVAKNESDIRALETLLSSDVQALQSQINNANIRISNNAVKIASSESKILNFENALKDKADLAALNSVSDSVEELRVIIGLRKEGETRTVFEILEAQDNKIAAQDTLISSLGDRVVTNTTTIAGLNEKLPVIEQNIENLKAKDIQLEENLAALLGTVNGKVDKREGYDLVSLENIAKLERISENPVAEGLIKSLSGEFILSDSGELSINQIEKSKVSGLEDALASIEGLHGLQINSQDVMVSTNKKINIMFDENNFTYANNMVSLKPMTLSDLVNPEEGEEEIVLNGGNA